MIPTIEALKVLGGSGTIDEIVEKIIENEKYFDAIQSELYNGDPRTKIEYRSVWARTYLKEVGVIENTRRGIWALTQKGRNLDLSKMPNLLVEARKNFQQRKELKVVDPDTQVEASEDEENWKSSLLQRGKSYGTSR